MIWLVWRQHRSELLGALVVLAGLGLLLLLHGVPMHQAYERNGIEACHAAITTSDSAPACVDDLIAFDDQYGFLPEESANWLPLAPALVGMLVGAPLLAREYEQRTWQLVWTQGVTRGRWLAAKLAGVLGGVLAVSVVFAAGYSWWIAPTEPAGFEPDEFNHSVLILPAYVLLAVVIGVLAGAVFRRTIVAAVLVIVGYLAVRLPVEFVLRPRFMDPLTTTDPGLAHDGWVVTGPASPTSGGTEGPFEYHPADRFWDFQLIEAALVLGVAAVLLLITWRLVLGRKVPRTEASRQRGSTAAGIP